MDLAGIGRSVVLTTLLYFEKYGNQEVFVFLHLKYCDGNIMGKVSRRDVVGALVAGGMIFLTIVFYGCAMGIHGETIVEWWIPVTVAVVMALVSGAVSGRFWARVTGSGSMLFNYLCHVVFSTGLFLTLFYGLNFAFADKNTEHYENAVVERKFSKTRHRTRRVGRNRMAPGEPYKVYYLDLRLPDGRLKEMSATLGQYNRRHKGDTVALPVERGLFGVPVIKRRGRKTEVPRPNRYREHRPYR